MLKSINPIFLFSTLLSIDIMKLLFILTSWCYCCGCGYCCGCCCFHFSSFPTFVSLILFVLWMCVFCFICPTAQMSFCLYDQFAFLAKCLSVPICLFVQMSFCAYLSKCPSVLHSFVYLFGCSKYWTYQNFSFVLVDFDRYLWTQWFFCCLNHPKMSIYYPTSLRRARR